MSFTAAKLDRRVRDAEVPFMMSQRDGFYKQATDAFSSSSGAFVEV